MSKTKTMLQNTKDSQLSKANDALASLKLNVTASDRQEACKLYSHYTVVTYLQGKGKDLDTAINLLTFFKGRIAQRDKLLAA